MLKRKILELYWALQDYNEVHNSQMDHEFEESRISANIIRLVHSIEKGMSIENPRMGFGISKINSILDYAEQYLKLKNANMLCIYGASDALNKYFAFHDEEQYSSEDYMNIRTRYNALLSNYAYFEGITHGGVQPLLKSDLNYDISEIEHFFKTRHSIRQFGSEKVELKDVKKAIALAQTAPSACNRQAVRVYAISPKKYIDDSESSLEGIGGFSDDVDYFLLITGKLSAYDEFEFKQFAISASIYAAYLSLALHAYKIGSCVIQRSIRNTEQWKKFRKKNNIPEDEQIVVMLGVGSLKEETIVPVSKRYEVDDIFRQL